MYILLSCNNSEYNFPSDQTLEWNISNANGNQTKYQQSKLNLCKMESNSWLNNYNPVQTIKLNAFVYVWKYGSSLIFRKTLQRFQSFECWTEPKCMKNRILVMITTIIGGYYFVCYSNRLNWKSINIFYCVNELLIRNHKCRTRWPDKSRYGSFNLIGIFSSSAIFLSFLFVRIFVAIADDLARNALFLF